LVGELLESLREPLQLLLIGVGVLSIIWGEVRDGVAIFVIILAVASIKTWCERRARRALDALQRLFAPHARVRRNGVTVDLHAHRLITGPRPIEAAFSGSTCARRTRSGPDGSSQIYVALPLMANVAPAELPCRQGPFSPHSPAFPIATRVLMDNSIIHELRR
jgi:hypothetical protein